MNACHVQASGNIELYFYDELEAGARQSIQQHLRVCSVCRGALDELEEIRSALAARPDVSMPADRSWEPFMARLDARVRQEPTAFSSAAPSSAARRRPVRHFAMAAMLALVTMGLTYVAHLRNTGPSDTTEVASGPVGVPIGTAAPEAKADPFDAAFASASEQHFERSKLVVLGLASKDPQTAAAEDWTSERELASALLNDTRLYRLTARERGLTAIAQVMSDLELVLLQASLSEERDADTLQRIQQLIRKRDLVTKMNVMNMSGI